MTTKKELENALLAYRKQHGQEEYRKLFDRLGAKTAKDISPQDFGSAIMTCKAGPKPDDVQANLNQTADRVYNRGKPDAKTSLQDAATGAQTVGAAVEAMSASYWDKRKGRTDA